MAELLEKKPSAPMRFMYHSLRERVRVAQGGAGDATPVRIPLTRTSRKCA